MKICGKWMKQELKWNKFTQSLIFDHFNVIIKVLSDFCLIYFYDYEKRQLLNTVGDLTLKPKINNSKVPWSI